MSKTLGQVAYEAHYETLVPSPEVVRNAFWKTAEPLVRDAWQAAAEAVVKADRKRSWPEPWNSNRKHHAVIEAARAQERLYAVYVDDGSGVDLYRAACVDTNIAVTALDSEEE